MYMVSIGCTLFNVQYTVYIIHCMTYSVRHDVQCTPWSVYAMVSIRTSYTYYIIPNFHMYNIRYTRRIHLHGVYSTRQSLGD